MGYILPFIIGGIILFSFAKRSETYSDFMEGARGGLDIVKDIFAPLLAISVASAMLRESGAFALLAQALSPILSRLNVPAEIIPRALIRPVSGSGSVAVLSDTLSTYGPDSRIGKIASVMMASTETTFYCIGIYFSKTGIKNTARALPCAILGDVCSVALSCFLIR